MLNGAEEMRQTLISGRGAIAVLLGLQMEECRGRFQWVEQVSQGK